MSISETLETLKRTIDDLQLEQRLETLGLDLDRISGQALESVGGYVSSREDDLTALIDKVATTIDSRTEGRFADQIGKATELARTGLARLADQGGDQQG